MYYIVYHNENVLGTLVSFQFSGAMHFLILLAKGTSSKEGSIVE